mmetsp:Transcript_2111/g.3729  ORF Transcript_2111/g.3729 Transcript_2111/m.3729 type:complete len:81 (+) Transcript_2111:316-558(+)|eukprot:CAMPEP_0168608664 /NCGR_PEP_ID=MMETSP0449_2-20121227/759_1 /TAXON_ID=1082188 /ORGANISM="Strombidium rassoulzadegani, Strain ras09" /LENGTH=80 /DNA_ID=CAMNT_0008648687 /DNA_START=229 /DNA_END=471 /DNA_ORIENTATION=+
MKELVSLLSNYKFKTDKQKELIEAFRELDHDADGFIPKDELVKYLASMGEPIEEHEINHLVTISKQTMDPENSMELIDIE